MSTPWGYIQPVTATLSLNASNGVFHPSRFRGRLFSAVSTARIASSDIVAKSVPFGKYHRMSPLVLSLVPLSHEWFPASTLAEVRNATQMPPVQEGEGVSVWIRYGGDGSAHSHHRVLQVELKSRHSGWADAILEIAGSRNVNNIAVLDESKWQRTILPGEGGVKHYYTNIVVYRAERNQSLNQILAEERERVARCA